MKTTTLSRMALLKMTSPPASMKSVTQAGFTIMELLITLAIVGVLAAIALPAFQNAYQLQTIKTTVSDAHISLLLARSEAIKRNASVEIVSLANGWEVQLASDDTVNFKTVDDMSSLVTVQCNTDADTAAEACPAPLVTYRRTGRIASSVEMRFFVASNNNVAMRCLTTSLSGRPYVEVDTDGDTTNGCN